MLLGALGSHPLTEAHLAAAQKFGAQVIGWDNDFVTPEHIRQVHSRGLKAWVWTVDEPARAAELIEWGVDGLISNVPREMLAVIGARRTQQLDMESHRGPVNHDRDQR
jgi:glycerophosphoryl diester phosphodiesterase